MQNTYRSNEEDTSTIIKISGEIPDVSERWKVEHANYP
jgi:hypothetical protein